MTKLNQVIAIEKSVKTRAHSRASEVYKRAQQRDNFSGFTKQFRPTEESGENRPPERRRVQLRASEALEGISEAFSEILDVTAQKDYANCEAKADVVVAGNVLVKDAPVTYLLFLEKYMNDIRTFVSKLPELTEDEDWQYNSATDLYQTEPLETQSTRKEQRPIVLYEATDKHPAQTQLISQDVLIGTWETVKQSGAVTKARKKTLLRRAEQLSKAIKVAREAANATEAPEQNVAENIFSWLLAD